MTIPHPVGDMPTIDQARAVAAAGLRVLPIKPGRKNPPMKSWQHAASVEEKAINAWWNGLYRDHGIGIAMGPQPDGRVLFAVDIDTHDEDANGFDTIADLEDANGMLPATVTSNTGSGGQHLIFAAPRDAIIRNQQNAGQRIGPGVDVRGDGGQIVVAPTVHPDTNRRYEWAAGAAPWETKVADAPDWLLDMVTDRPTPPPAPTPPRQHTAGTATSAADIIRDSWDWPAELARTGWQLSGVDGADTYYTRPGKDVRKGHSAVLHGTDGPFVVFTTEIPAELRALGHATRDGSGMSFSPLEWTAAYDHGGSMSAASRQALGNVTSTPSASTSAPPAPEVADDVPTDYDDVLRAMLVDWGEFWTTDHTAAEWIAEPFLAAHRSTALFAPGGTGKSLLALYVAACVAVGRTLFGRRIEARDVLYLDYEMTADDLAERLENMGFADDDLSRLHYALLPSLPPLDDPEGGKAVVRLAEMVDAELVVIDTFGRAVQGDENDADTVRSFYRWTGLHLKHAGRAFLRVDHAGKDVAKGQRGTSAKNDDVDVVWQMTVKEGGAYTLTAKKRRMGWVPLTVDLVMTEVDTMTFDLLHGISWPAGTKDVADRLETLGVGESVGVRPAAEALRAGGGKASQALVGAAQKYRREHSFLPVDNSRNALRNTPPAHPPVTPSVTVDGDAALPQVDALRNAVRNARNTPSTQLRNSASPVGGRTLQASDSTIPDDDQIEVF